MTDFEWVNCDANPAPSRVTEVKAYRWTCELCKETGLETYEHDAQDVIFDHLTEYHD